MFMFVCSSTSSTSKCGTCMEKTSSKIRSCLERTCKCGARAACCGVDCCIDVTCYCLTGLVLLAIIIVGVVINVAILKEVYKII